MIKQTIKKVTLFIITIGLFFSFFDPTVILAQSNNTKSVGITVSPAVFSNITVNPGDIENETIRISNPTQTTANIQMSVQDYTAVGENGDVTLLPPGQDASYSLSSWINLSTTQFSLPAGAYKFVSFKIVVPLNAEPGARYASVVASIPAQGSIGTTGSTMGSEVGSLLLLTVSGKASVNAQLLSFTNPTIMQGGTITFNQRIKDTGNVYIRPSGDVTITNIFGKTVRTISIEQEDILPGAVRATSESTNVTGWIGKYTATLSVIYGTDGQLKTIVKTSIFYVIPILPIAIILAVIIFFIFFRKNIVRAIKAFIKGDSESHNK